MQVKWKGMKYLSGGVNDASGNKDPLRNRVFGPLFLRSGSPAAGLLRTWFFLSFRRRGAFFFKSTAAFFERASAFFFWSLIAFFWMFLLVAFLFFMTFLPFFIVSAC